MQQRLIKKSYSTSWRFSNFWKGRLQININDLLNMLMNQVNKLIRPNSSPSVYYWCSILNFFDHNKTALNIDEIRVLAKESERCRISLNEDNIEILKIYKNGKITTLSHKRHGLNINQTDVTPNIIKHLHYLELNKHSDLK